MLFSQPSIQDIIQSFELASITAIEEKRQLITEWVQRAKTGRLQSQKEESVGTDFINDFFGEILNYYYRDGAYWHLEKELKTPLDGQKPDGAIGFFHQNETKNIISGVIEIKPYGVNLDKPQNRKGDRRTPVEQAFGYAYKFGARCKWVFVSNLKEIRLYRADDINIYDLFELESLAEDETLKRFLFLCSKERLIRPTGKSAVEKLLHEQADYNRYTEIQRDGHIIDKIYFSLKRFEGFGYFDPNTLANTQPFHKGTYPVWHYYDCTLASTEPDIHFFFANIRTKSDRVVLTDELLQSALTCGVIEPEEKANFIINRFNRLHICRVQCYEDPIIAMEHFNRSNAIGKTMNHELRDYANQLRTHNIPSLNSIYPADSLLPKLNEYEFKEVLRELYALEGTQRFFTPESMYLHVFFGTNDFKTAYAIGNEIAKRAKKTNPAAYFLSQYNKKLLNNLIRGYYWLSDQEKILDELRLLDLMNVVSDLSIYDYDLRKVISDLLSERYRHKAVEEIESLTESLQRVKHSFERGDNGSFPNYTTQLYHAVMPYFNSGVLNYLVGDHFTQHRTLCRKLINAFMLSYSINEHYYGRLKKIDHFILDIMLLDITPENLESIFKIHGIEQLSFSDAEAEKLLRGLINFLKSRRSDTIMFSAISDNVMDRAMLNHMFRDKYLDGFENVLLILARCEVPLEKGREIFREIKYFIEASDKMYGQRLSRLAGVIGNEQLGHDYSARVAVIKAMFEKKSINRYDPIKDSVLHLMLNYPQEFEADTVTWNLCLELAMRERSVRLAFVYAYHLLWPAAKADIKKIVTEKLNEQLHPILYIAALNNGLIRHDERTNFDQLVAWANKSKNSGQYEIYNGKPKLKNYDFINFLSVICIQRILLDLENFDKLEDWQRWAIRPDLFDPKQFKVEWLQLLYFGQFHEFYSGFEYVKTALRDYLKENPESGLKDVFIKHYI